jgi:hypothetical protein
MDTLKTAIVAAGTVGLIALVFLLVGPKQASQPINTGAAAGPVSTEEFRCIGGENGYCEYLKVGTCNAATSSPIAVRNPFNATSTATLISLELTGQATTTSLSVGTSTKSSGYALSDISPAFVNAVTVATTTGYITASGVTNGPNASFLSPGSGSQETIILGAGQYIGAHATTTATGAGANSYTPGYTNCTYKILFRR